MKFSTCQARVSLLLAQATMLVPLVAGCSASDGTEQTQSASEATIAPRPLHPGITWETQPGVASADDSCDDYAVAVPQSLLDFGYECTLGVYYVPPGSWSVEGWAFACRGNITTLPASLGMPGEHLPTIPKTPGSETITTSYRANSCFGPALAGWTLVVDEWDTGGSPFGGCPRGTCAQ